MATSTPEQPDTFKTADAAKAQGAGRKQPNAAAAQDPAEGPRPDKEEGHAVGAKAASVSGQGQSGDEAKRKAQPQAGGPQAGENVSALLMADHRAVEKLFNQYEDADEQRRSDIIERVSQALIIHTILEEEIFYPACREHFSEEDTLDDAQVEHDSVKILIGDLMHGRSNDPYRDAKFRVLAEQVRHHVCEEEQAGGIFQKAQACGIDTPELARRMTARRSQLESAGPLAATPPISLGRVALRRSRRDETRQFGRDEEERGQSHYRKEKEMASYQQYRDRDDRGRFVSQDGDDHRSSRRGNDRPRDEEGRFVSRSRMSGRDDNDDRDYGRRSEQRYGRDDDRQYSGRGRGHGGWFGDSEGHSEASRRGWENSDHGRSGWYGDSEGHSDASRRGWENPDHGRSGWYGDPEGHSEASRRGWDERGSSRRQDYDDDRDNARSRDHDERGYSSRSSSRGSRDDDRQGGRHQGWSGDPRGHSEAARSGWENRR
ncbi:hypothetical protein FHW96_002539 [Novosphingobium sp. SG751A]|uniref:hemerythrin domain-containing protein n=1 Tax=Novosphingobium sp. SG751A TaxID=2587000 RepID=UPI001556D0B9|nr:hemerythrin domain-containing protein [Novosphingobium sp. SG751A]NOW46379.1 hypothetical protein [Novosphingobium sp. SG751A]